MRRSYTIGSDLPGTAAALAGRDLVAIRAAIPRIAEYPTRRGADGLDKDGGAELATDLVATARAYARVLGQELPLAPGLADERRRFEALLDRQYEMANVREATEEKEDRRKRLVETMLALKHDRPVDDATLDEALRTFAALRGE